MSENTSYEIPQFVVNVIGRLLLENEALKQGVIPEKSIADDISLDSPS
jgi:hypothetical protein